MFIIEAVNQIAEHGWKLLPQYVQNLKSGQFYHYSKLDKMENFLTSKSQDSISQFITSASWTTKKRKSGSFFRVKRGFVQKSSEKPNYQKVLSKAKIMYEKASSQSDHPKVTNFMEDLPDDINREDIWWLLPSEAKKYLGERK